VRFLRSPWAKTRNEIIRVGVLQFFIAARFVNLAVSLPQYQFASHRLLLAEGHLHRRLFGQMLRRISALLVPSG
jgi:hypothetical protein